MVRPSTGEERLIFQEQVGLLPSSLFLQPVEFERTLPLKMHSLIRLLHDSASLTLKDALHDSASLTLKDALHDSASLTL